MIYIKAKAECNICDKECDVKLHVSGKEVITEYNEGDEPRTYSDHIGHISDVEYPNGWKAYTSGVVYCPEHNYK